MELEVPATDANINMKTAANRRVQKIIDREETYASNKIKTYGIIYGQCTRGLQNRIEEHEDYLKKIYNDPIELLKSIKQLCFGY